jgi:hypothetical protein
MDEELAVVYDELEAEDLEDDAQLGDAVTTKANGPGCYCGSM